MIRKNEKLFKLTKYRYKDVKMLKINIFLKCCHVVNYKDN